MDPALPDAVKHYLSRSGAIVDIVAQHPDPDQLLSAKIAPEMFETGLQLAIAIQFAARALCPPANVDLPKFPELFTCASLRAFHTHVTAHIASIAPAHMTHTVTHTAGDATVTQAPADYIARFALPNQVFHLTAAYTALRKEGVALGKADFDGLHAY